jgi:hypothetical protein
LATDPNRESLAGDGEMSFSSREDADTLMVKAARCRRLAAGVSDRQAAEVLMRMARSYEEAAARLNCGD